MPALALFSFLDSRIRAVKPQKPTTLGYYSASAGVHMDISYCSAEAFFFAYRFSKLIAAVAAVTALSPSALESRSVCAIRSHGGGG